jgi:hypothetical protein
VEEHAPLVPVHAGPLATVRDPFASVTGRNREFTFGFLMGYLSLALHATLEYGRFAGYYVGPWEPGAPRADEPLVRIWGSKVGRKTPYAPETDLGEMAAVLSDTYDDPLDTLTRLGALPPSDDPPRRVVARSRRPRVDLVVRPTNGHAWELYELAHETAERFHRNLD